MNKPTTPKQRKFIRALIRTFCPTEAAMRAFDCKNRLVARVIGSQLLTKLNINLVELMELAGLDNQQDMEDLARLRKAKRPIGATILVDKKGKLIRAEDEGCIEVDDNMTQLKALEMSLKLKGQLVNHVDVDLKGEAVKVINIIHNNGKPEENLITKIRGQSAAVPE